MNRIKLGVVGVGVISEVYLKNISTHYDDIQLYAVCDIVEERARTAAQKYGIPKVYPSLSALLADPKIDLILNLTRPSDHYKVSLSALNAGKHVYSEKPLADCFAKGDELVMLARKKGLLLGAAPDTFLGPGFQAAKQLIKQGTIGIPLGMEAAMYSHGHEHWHPNPEFYYKPGGGPMMDMGPYYLTGMVHLLGPIREVSAMSRCCFSKRIITSQPDNGKEINVEVPTYIAGNVLFVSGIIGTLFTTFDVYSDSRTRFLIYGSEGTMALPDPNTFGGPVSIYYPDKKAWEETHLAPSAAADARGIGLAGLVKAVQTGGDYAANGSLALHVLEVIEGLMSSADTGKTITIASAID